MMSMKWMGWAVGLFSIAAACSDGSDSAECVPGKVEACPCLGGTMGVQTCTLDSVFGECTCAADGDGGPGTADGGGLPGDGGGTGDASEITTPPTVLASGLWEPYELALTADAVFWTNTGGMALPYRGDISTIRKDGTDQAAIVEGLNRPTDLAVNDTHVYWMNEADATGQYSDLTGAGVSAPTPWLFTGADIYGDLALGPDALFVLAGGASSFIMSISTNPWDPAWATGLRNPPGYTFGMTNDGTNLFYVSAVYGTLGTSPFMPDLATSTGDPMTIATGMTTPVAVVADSGENVFVADAGSGLIYAIDKRGGPLTPLAATIDPAALALDATDVFWVERAAGRVMKVPRDGSAPATILAVDQQSPVSIAVDGTSVYWLNRGTLAADFMDGSLCRVAK